MTGPFTDPVVDAVAAAIGRCREGHEAAGLTPPTDEALARAALTAIGGAR